MHVPLFRRRRHIYLLDLRNDCSVRSALFLQNGAQSESLNSKGDTPLHEAARWNMLDMVHLLLRHGAQVRTRNKAQLTALQLAQVSDQPKSRE